MSCRRERGRDSAEHCSMACHDLLAGMCCSVDLLEITTTGIHGQSMDVFDSMTSAGSRHLSVRLARCGRDVQ